jgi:hypothetical protein
MDKELKEAMALIQKKCKEKNYYQEIEKLSLSKRVDTIKGQLLMYVDTLTLRYLKTQLEKKNPEHFEDWPFEKFEVTKREKAKALESLYWLKKDVEACISHLEEK